MTMYDEFVLGVLEDVFGDDYINEVTQQINRNLEETERWDITAMSY